MTTRATDQPTRAAAGVTVRPRARNPRGRGAELRTDILTAARALLDETGDIDAVTLRAVARRVGISAPSIYTHFPDRHAVLMALVEDAFDELHHQLAAAADDAGDINPAGSAASAASAAAGPVEQLHAVCAAYLHFAATQPQRYRLMFGGLWTATEAIDTSAVSRDQVAALGQDALAVFTASLRACVNADRSASTNPHADAVALWLGLHGLAHQRAVTAAFPWPADIVSRIVTPLAHLHDRAPALELAEE